MDLRSIAATTKAVPFCGGTVDVIGLSLRKLTQLIVRYPELMTLVGGGDDIANLVTSSPEAALSIVALGTGDLSERDSKKMLKAFDEATVGQQIDLLGSIIELTFAGQRAGPFLASLAARTGSAPPNTAETQAGISPSSGAT